MKKYLSVIMMIFSLSSHAFDLDGSCEKEAMNFGNGQGRDKISSECVQLVSDKVNQKLFRKSSDNKVKVFAYRNMVFVNDPGTKMKGQNVIAGKYTELENIEAVTLDEVNREVAVLEKSGDVLFFSSVITGNVAPRRILRNSEIEGATDLVVNPSQNEVIILNPDKKELLFFNRLANIHAPEGKKYLDVKKTVKIKSGDKLHLNVSKQELLVIDSLKKSALVFDLRAPGLTPVERPLKTN